MKYFILFLLLIGFFGTVQATPEFLYEIGKQNQIGEGKLVEPIDIAFDSVGDLYVASGGSIHYGIEKDSLPIQKYNALGEFQFQFGSWDEGQFVYPLSIATDSNDNIFVLDDSNSVLKFNSTGFFQTKIGSSIYHIDHGGWGTGDGEFNTPQGIATDLSGKIYVADTGNHRVQIFDSAGNYQSQFGKFGLENGEFRGPRGIIVDVSGNILVVDNGNHRVQIFDPSGTYLSQIGSYGSGKGEFSSPWNIAIDSHGKIYVTDPDNHRVQVFSSSGVYENQFSSWGYGRAEFEDLRGIEIDSDDKIYVTDVVNRSIKVFGDLDIPVEDRLEVWSNPSSKLVSPLKQFNSGVQSNEIICKDGLKLVEKHNNLPACVKPNSIPKLVERKWILFEQTPNKSPEMSKEQTDGPPGAGALGNEHSHAAILVKIFGYEFDFSAPAYQIKSPWIHFEGGDGITIHKHASGVTLGYLFDSLGMSLDSRFCYTLPDQRGFCTNEDYTLRFFFNGYESGGAVENYEIQDDDRILITYGAKSPQDIENQLADLNNRKSGD